MQYVHAHISIFLHILYEEVLYNLYLFKIKNNKIIF